LSVGYRFKPLAKGISLRGGATGAVGSFLPVMIPYLSAGFSF